MGRSGRIHQAYSIDMGDGSALMVAVNLSVGSYFHSSVAVEVRGGC